MSFAARPVGKTTLPVIHLTVIKIIPRAGDSTETNQISFSRVADRCISPPGVVVGVCVVPKGEEAVRSSLCLDERLSRYPRPPSVFF